MHDPAKRAVLLLDDQTVVVHVGDHRVELDLDAELLERLGSLAAELPAVHGQHGRGAVEEHDARFTRIDLAERAVQRSTGKLGDLPGQLHAGGAGADNDEGEQARTLGGIVRQFGLFEGPKDSSAQFEGVVDRFHSGGELRELVVAEVRLTGTGCHDQTVERRNSDAFEQARGHGLILEINGLDLTEQYLCVLLLAQHQSRGRSDVTDREDAGRNLIEERLKQMVGCTRDHRDVGIGFFESLSAEQSSEAGTDHHYAVAVRFNRLDAHSVLLEF